MKNNSEREKTSDENVNKSNDTKPLYSYTDSNEPNSNHYIANYNYGNRYDYRNNNSNGNANFNTYEFSNNENNKKPAYYRQNNKFGQRFVLILCACAFFACILIGITGFSLFNFIKGSANNGSVGSNNNNKTFGNGLNNNTGGNDSLPSNSNSVNYDNFAKITSTSTLNDVKDLLKASPTSKPIQDSTTLTQYTFGGVILVTFDDKGTIIDKRIDSSVVDFPNSTSNATFDEFQKLKPKMPLSDIESIFKSKGLLTESTYKSVEGYFIAGDSYTWPTNGLKASKNSYIICDFDSNNTLLRAQNYDKTLVPSSNNNNIDKGILDKFNAVNMGTLHDDVKSGFGSDPIMQSIGIPDNYMSSYYYGFKDAKITFIFDENNRVVARWITSNNYSFYDVNAKNSEKVNDIKKDMSYNDVKNILESDGYLCYEDCLDSKDYNATSKSYIWILSDNSGIQIDFDFSTPDGKAVQLVEL